MDKPANTTKLDNGLETITPQTPVYIAIQSSDWKCLTKTIGLFKEQKSFYESAEISIWSVFASGLISFITNFFITLCNPSNFINEKVYHRVLIVISIIHLVMLVICLFAILFFKNKKNMQKIELETTKAAVMEQIKKINKDSNISKYKVVLKQEDSAAVKNKKENKQTESTKKE